MTHERNYNFNESIEAKNNPKENRQRQQSVQYVADMLLELRNLAKQHECLTLQGLLEISYYEAFSEAHRVPVPSGEEEFLKLLGEDARRAAAAPEERDRRSRIRA